MQKQFLERHRAHLAGRELEVVILKDTSRRNVGRYDFRVAEIHTADGWRSKLSFVVEYNGWSGAPPEFVSGSAHGVASLPAKLEERLVDWLSEHYAAERRQWEHDFSIGGQER